MNVIILFAVIAIITASIGGLSLSIAGLGLLLKYTLLGSIVQHPRSNCERLLQWIVAHIKTFVWVGGLLLVLSICLKVTILVLWLNTHDIGERTMRILFIVLIPVALILMIMSGLVMYLWGVANALREGNPFKQIIEYGFKRDISDYIKFLAERSGKMPLVGACVALIGALLLVGFFIAIS